MSKLHGEKGKDKCVYIYIYMWYIRYTVYDIYIYFLIYVCIYIYIDMYIYIYICSGENIMYINQFKRYLPILYIIYIYIVPNGILRQTRDT